MKSLTFLFFSVFFLPTFLFAQSQERALGSFQGIHVTEGIELVAVKGNNNQINLEYSHIEAEKILTEISNGVLKIHLKRGRHKRGRSIKAVLTYTDDPNFIKVTTGSKVRYQSMIATENLSVDVTTSGELHLNAKALNIHVDVTTGSKLVIQGSTEALDISATTGSNIDGADLKAETVVVNATTGSNLKVSANKILKGKASTGSKISYQGSPKLEVKTSTGGSFKSSGK